MKKILLFLCLFISLNLSAQNQKEYLIIGYSSICCGTPSSTPVLDTLKSFRSKYKLPTFEVLVQRGLGEEGEYDLYVGIDALSEAQKKELKSVLQQVAQKQNNARKENHDGYVRMEDKTVTGTELKKVKVTYWNESANEKVLDMGIVRYPPHVAATSGDACGSSSK